MPYTNAEIAIMFNDEDPELTIIVSIHSEHLM